jgi:hypothetical protein
MSSLEELMTSLAGVPMEPMYSEAIPREARDPTVICGSAFAVSAVIARWHKEKI